MGTVESVSVVGGAAGAHVRTAAADGPSVGRHLTQPFGEGLRQLGRIVMVWSAKPPFVTC